MLLGEQAAQQTPGLESVRRIGVGVECSSVAPFAFLVLPTRAVANMGQREHKQQLFCFCFFKCGDVVGTHTHDRLRAPNRLAFVRARSVSNGRRGRVDGC